MKSLKIAVVAPLILALASALSFGQATANPQFPANANGAVMADEFGKWAFLSQTGISSGAQTVTLNGCYIKVGTGYQQFYPIAVNVPLYITDGANSEVGDSHLRNPAHCGHWTIHGEPVQLYLHSDVCELAYQSGLLCQLERWRAGRGDELRHGQGHRAGGHRVDLADHQHPIAGRAALSASAARRLPRAQRSVLEPAAEHADRAGHAGPTGGNRLRSLHRLEHSLRRYHGRHLVERSSLFLCDLCSHPGRKNPCSTTAHYTTAGSLALNFLAPAASTGSGRVESLRRRLLRHGLSVADYFDQLHPDHT